MIEIKISPPRMDGRHREAFSLETWRMGVKAKMGSRDYISPFGAYESLVGRNSEIRGDLWEIFSPLVEAINESGSGKLRQR